MKMRINLFAAFLAASLAIAAPVLAEDPQGSIDWVNGFVVATGQGTASAREPKAIAKLKALRAAEVMAQRALLEVIKGVRIDSQTTVKNMMLEEDVINTRVEGFLRGAMVTKRNVEIVDGAPLATVEMKVCMTGATGECASRPSLVGILDIDKRKEPPYVPAQHIILVVPSDETAKDTPPPAAAPPATPPAARKLPPVAPPVPPSKQAAGPPAVYDSTKPVTGIIFDLEGRYFQPEVLPVVITKGTGESMQTLYSVKCVNPSVIRTYGAVRYADSLENARHIQSIGNNPLIVYVDGVTKENMLFLEADDASIIKQTISNGNNYLSDAKVVISIR